MTPYQFCSNNPIWLRELDGLEGVRFTDFDENGNAKTTIVKDVVIMLKNSVTAPEGASQKEIIKVFKQNQKIAQENAERVSSIKSDLETSYDGATDSQGNQVSFNFNIHIAYDLDGKGTTQDMKNQQYNDLAKAYGMDSILKGADGSEMQILTPAAVFTNESAPGGTQGETKGARIICNN